MRCLWIMRHHPYPADAGDHIYSKHLIEGLAEQGVDVVVVGRRRDGAHVPGSDLVDWRLVDGPPRSAAGSLLSPLPNVAHQFAGRPLRAEVGRGLRERWDVVLLDNVGAGWALPLVTAARAAGRIGTIGYVSHNHESSTRMSVARSARGRLRRMLLTLDAAKVGPLERRMVAAADLVTANTEIDAAAFRRQAPDQRYLVLVPGYGDRVVEARTLTAELPRRAVVVGSLDWIAKRINLEEFLEVADPMFAAAGAELYVIGRGPQDWIDRMRSGLRATTFTGFVDSVVDHLDAARIGVISERGGGGFKHRALYYVFNRVPVAVLDGSVADMPLEPGEHMLAAPTVPALVTAILDRLDDLPSLQRMQDEAFARCAGQFNWASRGRDLFVALDRIAEPVD